MMIMAQTLDEVMTRDPLTVEALASVLDAAMAMAGGDIGLVVVAEEDGTVRGIVTDRDIVVRAVAQGLDPASTPVSSICSEELAILSPSDPVEKAVELMKQRAVRRIPVVENHRAVGVVSLGDLALDRDPDSALGQVSSAPPNR
jgi:CBS domain-containing protein